MRKQRSNPTSPNVSVVSAASSSSRPQMYPESDSSSRSSTSSESNSPTISRSSQVSQNSSKLVLENLGRKVEILSDNVVSSLSSAQHDEYESQSSGVDSLKLDLEDEISSSLHLARKHGDERLEVERRRHSEQMDSLEKERDLERRNFQLRYEQMLAERDKFKSEVNGLRDKVGLLSVEKTMLEEQVMESVKNQAAKEEADSEEEMKRKDREEELVFTVKNLSERVANQDQELAELKEDNIVLKKQIKELSVKEAKSSSFRIFGGTGKENICSTAYEDPKVN